MDIMFGLMDQCDTKIGLIKYMQINDLYFVVQSFFLPYILTANGRGYLCTSTCSSLTFFLSKCIDQLWSVQNKKKLQ